MTRIPVARCRIYQNNFKRHYLRNKRLFLDFLLHFWNLHETSSIFKKKMSILGELFPRLLILKNVGTKTSKRSCFRTPFGNEPVNGFQTLLKAARHPYYPPFLWIRDKLSWKKSALVWTEMLSLFANTLTADEKYSRRNLREFLVTISNAIISSTKAFFCISYWISEICMKLRAFPKKRSVS